VSRFGLSLALSLLLLPLGLAQKFGGGGGGGASGVLYLSFGKVRQWDGTYKNIAGMPIRFTVEPIQLGNKGIKPSPFEGPALTTVFRNDNGAGSYFYTGDEFPMPSALDDVVMNASGSGQPWKHLTVGYHMAERGTVLLRWICFDTFVAGRGPGVSAFDGVIADFGGLLTITQALFPQIPGTYKITFDVAAAGVAIPDGEFFFATQMRYPDPPLYRGEGPFNSNFWPVFSGGGVAIGTSDDLFYYDYDPVPNGIYDETELDYFGGPPNHANFLLQIDVSGTAQDVYPSFVQVTNGTYLSGTFLDLWYSEDFWYSAQIDPQSEAANPIEILVETQAPTNIITSLNFTIEAHTSDSGFEQLVYLFNFTTNQWRLILQSTTSIADNVLTAVITSNPSQYIRASDRKMRALIVYREFAAEVANLWSAHIDRATWGIVRP